jgi:hypothetical protein
VRRLLGETLEGARFLASLPRFLRRPITLDEARTALRHRLEHRADDFLWLAREVISRQPSGPYRQLLALAGCEYGDLERLVRREGVEAALATLLRHGVYLTVDEFKGRRPIVRGRTTIGVETDALRDPGAARHLSVHTGGSRGAGSSVSIDLATAVRLATIRRSGATCWPQYASVEAGVVGRACLAPAAPDEVHVHDDRLALIQPDSPDLPSGLTAGALLTTSLRRTATALILLNVSMGDVAILDRRRCGCPLERLGWTLHLHDIRSVEKLTAAGMTFLDTDVIRVLEEVLPERFGGGPTDYQLVEEEDVEGRPGLRLFVDPAVGPLAPDAVTEAFLSAIGTGQGAQRVMGLAWRDAALLRVERRVPLVTASGKILHLHANGAMSARRP